MGAVAVAVLIFMELVVPQAETAEVLVLDPYAIIDEISVSRDTNGLSATVRGDRVFWIEQSRTRAELYIFTVDGETTLVNLGPVFAESSFGSGPLRIDAGSTVDGIEAGTIAIEERRGSFYIGLPDQERLLVVGRDER